MEENNFTYHRFDPSYIKDKDHPHLESVTDAWQTMCGTYQILQSYPNGFKHLRICRIDGEPIHSYMDMQWIKNDLWGEKIVAIEVYPDNTQFVNGSNTYHLWTWPGIENQIPNLKKLYTYDKVS